MNDLYTLSAGQLAARVRARELSPVALVDAHIERLEAVNPLINALAAARFERARAEARAAERTLAGGGDCPPLLGVPCTIKSFLAVADMPHHAGLVARRDVVASADAAVVARLRAAGAIVIGLGSVPEGGMWIETVNRLVGRTDNPWDVSRTPGGSSGGEAALIAAGAAPFALGSDIGGSIRIPAAFCGLAGHKPSGGLVPNTGHWGAERGQNRYLCIGPLARRVSDLSVILGLIAGPDGVDVGADAALDREVRAGLSGDLGPGRLDGVTVYPLERVGDVAITPVMAAQVEHVSAALRARGAIIARPDPARLRGLGKIWLAAMYDLGRANQAPSFATLLGDGDTISPARELLRLAARKLIGGRGADTSAHFTAPALGLAALEQLVSALPTAALSRLPRPRALRAALEAELGPDGVYVLPPYPRPAPRHGEALLRPFEFLCTALCNITELPATQVPTGFDINGLPVGVQIVARHGNDALALRVAAAVEQDFGDSWRPAPVSPG